MKAKNSGDYYNLAKEVIYSEFEKNADATKLTRPDINRKVCSLLCGKKPGITTKKTQTSVHRALETLVNEKIVYCNCRSQSPKGHATGRSSGLSGLPR